jgi:hypothetical protein
VNWIEVLAHQERHKDILRKAERERLVRQALAAREKRERFYGPALIWLGRRLVAWGGLLQERYGAASRGLRASACQSNPVSVQNVTD